MKKTLLFAFALLFATATMAQNRAVLLQESFDGTSMPAGWSISAQSSNWEVSGTNNAGGQPNEMHLTWSPQFNGMTRLVSPAVDLTGLNSVVFSFKHALDNYSGSNTIGVATSSDGGSTWNEGWSQGYSNSNTYSVSQEISTPDLGQPNVQFCIFFNGSSYNINDWFFDDIMVFTLENLDLNLTAATLSDFIGSGSTEFGINVMNMGSTAVTSVEASYQVEGMAPVTETFTVNIPSLGASTLTFNTPTILAPGSYNVDYSINLVNGQADDIVDNNTLSKAVSVALATAERIPMIEHFTSSTCGPCVSVNTQMLTFCNNNPGRYTYTKYQMNWPGNGDPYYTAEGGVRRTYYGVNAVPYVFLDSEYNTPVSQTVFDQHAAKPAFFDITGSFSVEGNNINVIIDVMPYVDANARLYVTVNEKITTGNVGSNGEHEFRHVMMKMLPDAQGTTIDFVASELQHIEFTQDMSSTHVEEMDDLEVAIFIQNYGSKEIYNSHYAYEYTDIHPYPVENLTFVLSGDNFMANWNAPTQGTPTGYNVYLNGVLVAENITETDYAWQDDPNEFYIIGVEAVYGEMTSVKTVATIDAGLEDKGLVTENLNVTLDESNPFAELIVFNANLNTQNPIVISSIEEVSEDGVQYLTIDGEDLPYLLPFAEFYMIHVEPNFLVTKSVAHTSIVVESDGGSLTFLVEIDGELLNITEVSSKAKVYPNPASDQVRVESATGIENVKVYNVLGALVEMVSANGKSVNVNTANYSNGVYFFNIRQSDGTVSNQRVVVNH